MMYEIIQLISVETTIRKLIGVLNFPEKGIFLIFLGISKKYLVHIITFPKDFVSWEIS